MEGVELERLEKATEVRKEPEAAPEALKSTIVKTKPNFGRVDLWSLLGQQFSSTWSSRAAEFAWYLNLVVLRPNTLIPASVYGFVTTSAGILLSGPLGSYVDATPKLRLVRTAIVLQKIAATCVYAPLLAMFILSRDGPISDNVFWGCFAVIVVFGTLHKLSTTLLNVAIERDWITCVTEGDSDLLTKLNTHLRRIDLLCKLLSPLFVSLLTTAASYLFANAFLLGLDLAGMLFELYWIGLLYRRLPQLAAADTTQRARKASQRQALEAKGPHVRAPLHQRILSRLSTQLQDWKEFIHHPIFMSSVAISFLYLTVLSFDGTMLGYLKAHDYNDAFLAGMRGVLVVAGLLGTLVMPLLERYVGLVRTGSWSIISEVVTLIPALLSFYIGTAPIGQKNPRWNAALLFTGMALSRIGLWSFDLAQLKCLQLALNDHPRRNALTARQFAMQDIAQLLKYVTTMIFATPSVFKWAGLISFISVGCGAVSFAVYVVKERGHYFHVPTWKKSS